LEHASATFHIVTDRGITHEIVRHRLASYSQESTRYCNYGKEKFGTQISVVVPGMTEPLTPEQYDIWYRTIMATEKGYMELIDTGLKPEFARSVLPTCLKTEIAMTCNLREWEHFLKLRLKGVTGKPHPDIRVIGYYIWQELMQYCPPLFGQFEESAQEVAAAIADTEAGE
jgi:thymidylate synthase (FAD)